MAVSASNYAPKKELTQGETVVEIDFGFGQRFAFGFAKFNGLIYPTKRIVWLGGGQVDWNALGVTLDASPKIVGVDFFNQYKQPMIQAYPAFANSYFAALAPNTVAPIAGGATLAAAGLVSTDPIGLFTDGTGVITTTAPVELSFDEKLAKAISTTDAAATSSSTSFSELIKKPINWVYAIGAVVLGYVGIKYLGKKKK